MKILHVINVRWFNATAWYALTLAKLQREHGHNVAIITIEGTDTDKKAKEIGFTPLYINLTSSHPFVMLRSFFQLSQYITQFSPDIINCHRGESFIFFALLRQYHTFTLIRTRGDQRLPKKNVINAFIHKYCTDAIIATNTKMKEALEERFHLQKGSVYTVLGGVDTKKFSYSPIGRKEIRRKYGFQDNEYVFGILGRLDWVKGQKELIQAIALINTTTIYKVKLLIIGFSAGITEEQVYEWIEQAGMQEYIFITGKCDAVVDYLSALDIGIISSLGSETIARAALELISCGIPLLSTDIGVMTDILPKELLIALPQGDEAIITALRDAILSCLADPLYREKALQAQQNILASLTEEYFYTVTQRIYEEAIQKKGSCE